MSFHNTSIQVTILMLPANDNTFVFFLEPVDGIFLSDELVVADLRAAAFTASNTHARARQDNVEIHTIDTNLRIVLDTQIDVFIDTETEVTVFAEVASL